MAKVPSGYRRKTVVVKKKTATATQKAALAKGRKKGAAIMECAQEIQMEGGKRTITKQVYKIPMSEAVKKAAKQMGKK